MRSKASKFLYQRLPMTQGKLFFFPEAVLVERAVCDGREGFGAAAGDGLRSASFVILYFSYFLYLYDASFVVYFSHMSHIYFFPPMLLGMWGLSLRNQSGDCYRLGAACQTLAPEPPTIN